MTKNNKLIIILLITALPFLAPQTTKASQQKNAGQSILTNINKPFSGDLPELKDRRAIRVLIPWSLTHYFLVKGEPHGFEYSLSKEYEKFLNKNTDKTSKVEFIFIPMHFSKIIPALLEKKGDIAAANLTITKERSKKVLFSTPYYKNVKEVIVANKQAPTLRNTDDLSEKEITVTKGSSYFTHLQALDDSLKNKNFSGIDIIEAQAEMQTEDVLEMLNSGLIEYAVADLHIAQLWQKVLPDIIVYPDILVHQGGQIAWAVQKGNNELITSINKFMKKNKKGTLIGNILFTRYLKDTKWINNPLSSTEQKKIRDLIPLFRKYSEKYHFDWLLMAAQGFQESKLEQSTKSHAGAIGIMQLLPSTAKDPKINIPDIENTENNIHAGIKYMALLRDTYFNENLLTEADQIRFTLAAYNCGPNKTKRLRKKAKEQGLNPNIWFSNVEYLAPAETRRYVANIHKYYLAYRTIADKNFIDA